MKILSKLKF